MNNPTGVELPSVTVAVQEVVLPTATELGVQVIDVDVSAAVIAKESVPELAEKSLVPPELAEIVVDESPTVNPVTVTVQESVEQVSEEMETVPLPGEPKDHENSPVGIELPSVTVAVHDVVAPTATVSGEQLTAVAVVAGVIVGVSEPELARKSLLPANEAVIVVLPSPTVSPVIVTMQELELQLSEEMEIVPVPGVP